MAAHARREGAARRAPGATRGPACLPLALLLLLLVPAAARATTAPAAPVPSAPAGADPLGPERLEVYPEEVGVDLLFSGATLHVRGAVPAGSDAAILCTGQETRLKLKRRGRVWGVLWMNVADVVFERVPSVYVLCTSVPLARLGPPELLERLGVGFGSVEARALPRDPSRDQREAFPELVRLKRREGLFDLVEGSVLLGRGERDRLDASTDLFLPARTPPGGYRIALFSFRQGEGALVAEATAVIRQTGVAAFVSRTARERGLLYGIVAVVVAIAAGLSTGALFGRGARGAH